MCLLGVFRVVEKLLGIDWMIAPIGTPIYVSSNTDMLNFRCVIEDNPLDTSYWSMKRRGVRRLVKRSLSGHSDL